MTLLHELRNPLAPLLGAANVLRTSPSEDSRRMAEVIARQTEVLRRLIEEAQSATHDVNERLLVSPVGLTNAIRAVVDGLQDDASRRVLSLRFVEPPCDIVVEADRERLQQMLLNLISNAIKYTPQHGHVTVSATVEADGAAIRVEDDGIGIAPESVRHIFDLFTRERSDDVEAASGLGVGLAVVRKLASLHKGSVEARSQGKGKGSVFTLQLPLKQ
jgi:signal transduction histidine kinase